MRTVVILSAALLCACGSKTACSGLSDKDAVARVMAQYGKLSAAEQGDAKQMQFSPARAVGIGSNKALTQLWFMQDDHTLTVATLTEDCQLQFRPGLAPDAVNQAAIPTHKPSI